MRAVRVVCLIAVALGAIAMAFPPDEMPVVPFPGPGQTVVLLADITHNGDYKLLITSPTSDTSSPLLEEHIPCEFDVTLAAEGLSPHRRRIQTLNRSGQIGSMRLDEFTSDASWRLNRGPLSVQVSGTGHCNAIASRGGALSIEAQQTHITERYLLNQLIYWGGRGLLTLGLLALALMEIRSGHARTRRS